MTEQMRYCALRENHGIRGTPFLGPGIHDTVTGKFHARPEYSDDDLADTCRWLNNRPAYKLDAAAEVRILNAHLLMPNSQFLTDTRKD